ncbi:MAG: helix-turn-helix domain-containing protein [Gemmatimonas sp.]
MTKIAERLGVTRETIYAWIRAANRAGGRPPPPRRPGRTPRSPVERAAVERTVRRHVAQAHESERTTESLRVWFENTFGLRYASSTLERLLWRMGCTCTVTCSDSRSVTTWSFSLPRHPDWLTPERMRRIETLVRKAAEPTISKVPLTVRALTDDMRTMKRAMQEARASETDLLHALNSAGIVEHPVSKELVFEEDAEPRTAAAG